MAVLNLDNYSGKDLYTDGDVEDVIADIVKNGQDYTAFAGMDDYFALMYHLSPERENILNWYPFHKSDSILEVGAGCGAITGVLCEKAGWVTAVELSRKRAGINYARHQSLDNLEILVGNVNEMELNRRYDYVILTGVFEYAAGYSRSTDPYEDFLNSLKKYLRKNGKILISIENRLGVKYFAGAMEDHTSKYYVGICQYENIRNVRTFSRGELEGLFKKCGIHHWKFYYPYPDYKFPLEIFTDENVNTEIYGRLYRNYQKGNVEIFNELEMVMALKKEAVMGSFSNSFFIELCVDDVKPCNVVYAKLNNMRKKQYRIATVITKNKGYFVTKSALHKKAENHVKQIFHNEKKRLPDIFLYLNGEWQGGGGKSRIQYPYLEHQNLDSRFLQWLQSGETEKIKSHIDRICASLMKVSEYVEDFYGKEFITYFGTKKYCGAMECICEANIDLIFDNLFWIESKYIVIDPEWILDFWVPVKFVIWRMLNEWYSKYPLANQILPGEQMYTEYEITSEMADVFRCWAVHFVSFYVSDADIDKGTESVLKVDIDAALKQQLYERSLQSALYIDYGQGFTENEKSLCTVEVTEGRFQLEFTLNPLKTIFHLRWDPVEGRFCRCNVKECYLDGQKVAVCPLNAVKEDDAVFLNSDPQILIFMESGNYKNLKIIGDFEQLEDAYIEQKICSLLEDNEKIKREKNSFWEEIKLLEAQKAQLQDEKNILQEKLDKMDADIEKLYKNMQCIKTELNDIKNSRGWRILCFLKKFRRQR